MPHVVARNSSRPAVYTRDQRSNAALYRWFRSLLPVLAATMACSRASASWIQAISSRSAKPHCRNASRTAAGCESSGTGRRGGSGTEIGAVRCGGGSRSEPLTTLNRPLPRSAGDSSTHSWYQDSGPLERPLGGRCAQASRHMCSKPVAGARWELCSRVPTIAWIRDRPSGRALGQKAEHLYCLPAKHFQFGRWRFDRAGGTSASTLRRLARARVRPAGQDRRLGHRMVGLDCLDAHRGCLHPCPYLYACIRSLRDHDLRNGCSPRIAGLCP